MTDEGDRKATPLAEPQQPLRGPIRVVVMLLSIAIGAGLWFVVIRPACSPDAGNPNDPTTGGKPRHDLPYNALPAIAPHKPNVLVITLDTVRADRIGCYAPGDPYLSTPTIDTLATRGTRFTRAFTVVPLTLPAHASLFTARTPLATKVRDNANVRLADEEQTLAEVLAGLGYDTGAFVSAATTASALGLAQGFATYDDAFMDGEADTTGEVWVRERDGAETVDRALAWLKPRVDSDRPWFLWVHLFDPHHPYAPPADLRPDSRRRPADSSLPGTLDPSTYDAEITYADAQVRRLLDSLEPREGQDISRSARGRTLIALTSDHGDGLGDHGESTHGYFAFASTMRIPLILSGPGVRSGTVDETRTASIVDVMPTLLSRIPAVEGVALQQPIHGRDLLATSGATASYVPASGQYGNGDSEGRAYFETFFGALNFGYHEIRGLATDDGVILHAGSGDATRIYAPSDFAQRNALTDDALTQRLRAALDATLAKHSSAPPGSISTSSPAGTAYPFRDNPTDTNTGSATNPFHAWRDRAPIAAEEHLDDANDRPAPWTRADEIAAFEQAQRAFSHRTYGAAEERFTAIITGNPAHALAWQYLANARFRVALRDYNAAVATRGGVHPRAADARVLCAGFESASQAYARFAQLVRESIARQNDQAASQVRLPAEVLTTQGLFAFFSSRYADTVAAFEALPAGAPLGETALMAWALALYHVDGLPDAALSMLGARSIAPDSDLAKLIAFLETYELKPADDLNPEFGFPAPGDTE